MPPQLRSFLLRFPLNGCPTMRLRLLLAACSASLLSTACHASGLTVTAGNLRSDTGQVLICVFSADGSDKAEFPDCVKGHGVRYAQAPVSGGKAVFTFDGLKDGVYAVAIVHDENGNGKLDTNFLGIPAEGVGVSTNPRVFGKPSFEQGQFSLKGNGAITIEAKYIL
jgi:uncharacterized protein (DUF2141 family)